MGPEGEATASPFFRALSHAGILLGMEEAVETLLEPSLEEAYPTPQELAEAEAFLQEILEEDPSSPEPTLEEVAEALLEWNPVKVYLTDMAQTPPLDPGGRGGARAQGP